MRPFLARPWIHAFKHGEFSAPWWTSAQRSAAANVFRSPISAHPVLVVQTLHMLPTTGIPQICMVGHSNVGKSTLINGLVYDKEIARPSHFPGRTRHLFVFDLSQQLSLVDLPGYGHARASKQLRADWARLVKGYLEKSSTLKRVVCLVDAATGLSEEDIRFWDVVQRAGRKLMVVLTKVDLCHAEDLHRNVAEVIAALQPLDKRLVWPYVHAVSASSDLGMRELRASLSVESVVGSATMAATASTGPQVSEVGGTVATVAKLGHARRGRQRGLESNIFKSRR